MSSSMSPEDESHDSKNDEPAFGWTSYAEKINGRFAMVGLVSLLILEVLTRQDFLTWLGLR
jgi:Chlorophyll A-B binding protein